MSKPVTIVGAGLAGCTLAWQCHLRGVPFLLIEDQPTAAGSLAAAGMLAPVTGKAFNPSWRIDEFYQPAREFYAQVEQVLGTQLWYDYPVVRLFFDTKDRAKFEKKRTSNLEPWIAEVCNEVPNAIADDGAVIWQGSGRVNVADFVRRSRAFFQAHQSYEETSIPSSAKTIIFTTGARGLVDQNPVNLPHRSAKGEILTVKIPGLRQDQIISRGTWIVPTGKHDETFLCGANYDWDDLSNTPTASGRETVESGLTSLTPLPYEVLDHVAGVRPIVRRSEPVMGRSAEGHAYLNGLGSKGTLYAPKAAEYLLEHLLTGDEIPLYLQAM